MANINPKLNLNKTPNLTDNNSLIFAKNIRLDVDNTVHEDYGVTSLLYKERGSRTYYYNNIVERILADFKYITDSILDESINKEIYNYYYNRLNNLVNVNNDIEGWQSGTYKIVGVIKDINSFFLFIDGSFNIIVSGISVHPNFSTIVEYRESDELFAPCNCVWKYTAGSIDGCLIKHLNGDRILCIAETGSNDKLVPLKFINLNKSNYTDDDSVYTQTPEVPFINLNYIDKFIYTIPNGVYQFFVRYKIRDGFYTDWFPASKELFAGNKNSVSTNFGTLTYNNINNDSDYSFVLQVQAALSSKIKIYESFQVGFICSHDDSIVARAWKHFPINVNSINFDYEASDAEEIEVTDLTKVTYQLFNVGNITAFKNRIYVSNYTETDFNKNCSELAKEIDIVINNEEITSGYKGYSVNTVDINNELYIRSLNIDGANVEFSGVNGIIDRLISNNENSIRAVIDRCFDQPMEVSNVSVSTDKYGFGASLAGKTPRESFNETQDLWGTSRRGYNPTNVVTRIEINDGYETTYFTNVGNNELDFKQELFNYLLTKIPYLNDNIHFVNTGLKPVNTFRIEIWREYEYNFTSSLDGQIHRGTDVYIQPIYFSILANPSYYVKSAVDENIVNYSTLVPYQQYKFYIHYVKSTGETTNGFLCKEVTAPYKANANCILYPKFSNIRLPAGYSTCFFSIAHTSVNSSTIFNIKDYKDNPDIGKSEGISLEINTRLITNTYDFKCKQDDKVFRANYYYSSDASYLRYFGAYGVVAFNKDQAVNANDFVYAINEYNTVDDNIELIKCTPYITGLSFDDYTNMNLLGYICNVTVLDSERCIDYYSDGTTIFKKENTTTINNDNYSFKLTELGKYTDSTYKLSDFGLKLSPSIKIYSNYNFNYLTITSNPKQVVKTYYNYDSNATSSSNEANTNTVIFRVLESLILSEIYSLPSMYLNYTRKTYSIYKENEITKFDNTIRGSKLEGDENEVNVYKFEANDYYNIPTNKGIITNLVAIGDTILVHTYDSMFKFKGSNTLQSNEGEVQVNESQPFDTGVSEIFGSDFGFAGLQHKSEHIITENGYIFYDSDCKVIYLYAGNNQMIRLSDKIQKLLRRKNIAHISFANDFYNNRFFISIMFSDSNYVTLSFSTLNDVRDFISLHDFKFYTAFNTKSKCYFFNLNKTDICQIDKKHKLMYDGGLAIIEDVIYPSKKSLHAIDVVNQSDNYTVYKCSSIIDIIENSNYEFIKTLNFIEWCSRYILDEFVNIEKRDPLTLKMAETINREIPAGTLRIYTDTCMSNEIIFSAEIANSSITNPNAYTYPRYNQGKWTLNYFRDIENANDRYNYLPKYNDGRKTAIYRSDDNSLMEGKYFVFRFTFASNFKFETLHVNYNNKI